MHSLEEWAAPVPEDNGPAPVGLTVLGERLPSARHTNAIGSTAPTESVGAQPAEATMRYEEFVVAWNEELRRAGFRVLGWPVESIELPSMGRSYMVRLEPFGGQDVKPLFVTAALSWQWGALETARTVTTEDDLLTTLLGSTDTDRVQTERSRLRIDITFHATFPFGEPIQMPDAPTRARWFRETVARLDSIEPLLPEEIVRESKRQGGPVEVLAWRGDPELEVTCGADGGLKLHGVKLAAWQGIDLPRQWDNSERKRDEHPAGHLRAMFARVKVALHAWMEAADHLRPSLVSH